MLVLNVAEPKGSRLAANDWSGVRDVGLMRYVFNDLLTNPSVVQNGKLQRFGDNYRNMQLYARHFVTPNWGVSARLDRDLVENTWRRSTVSVIYRNDCIWYELIYQRNDSEAYRLRGKPSSAILFRLNLSTLGSSGAISMKAHALSHKAGTPLSQTSYWKLSIPINAAVGV